MCDEKFAQSTADRAEEIMAAQLRSPLHLDARIMLAKSVYQVHESLARRLLASGRSGGAELLMIELIRSGRAHLVQICLLMVDDAMPDTALHVLAEHSHAHLVDLLCEKKAPLDTRDELGRTAVEIALTKGIAGAGAALCLIKAGAAATAHQQNVAAMMKTEAPSNNSVTVQASAKQDFFGQVGPRPTQDPNVNSFIDTWWPSSAFGLPAMLQTREAIQKERERIAVEKVSDGAVCTTEKSGAGFL